MHSAAVHSFGAMEKAREEHPAVAARKVVDWYANQLALEARTKPPSFGVFDKVLTGFINFWSALALFLMVVDILAIIHHSDWWLTGVVAAADKWFNPLNVVHLIAEMIFVSPAFGAYLWREKRRAALMRDRITGAPSP